ncbi:hypothetical protein HWV62_17850 [Athelia sp. TMB]|nr:hypothetical protein HWV62_17850 [Athelia sp. TMB]
MSTSPDRKSWAQNKITALYSADSDKGLEQAFQSTFASSVQIKVSDEAWQREDLKSDLLSRRGAAVSATVEWDRCDVETTDEQTGSFNGAFTVKRSMRYRIRAAPAQLHTHISTSAQ